jgi:CRISPR-associated protein Cmr2
MSQHLFLFTIGPVQSFIAQARKTQDLYAGSCILSDLIKTGIQVVQSKHKIIFPFAEDLENIESLPNRFVALINEGTDLPKLGKDVEEAVREKWDTIAQNIFSDVFTKKIQSFQNIKIDFAGINQQIKHHLEIHWLFEEYSDETKYKDTFKSLEKKLGAIKNARVFQQFEYNSIGERGRKCSVDGHRNVKFYRRSETQKNWNDNDLEKSPLYASDNFKFKYDNELPLSILQPGEGLSAVSFVKRCYNNEEFESTADIALLNWISHLKNNSKFKDYKKCFSEFNAQLLFDENINESYLKKQGIRLLNKKTIDTLNMDLKELREIAKEGGFKQSKYYAIIAFDGDKMGEWLGGKHLSDGQNLQDFHKDFAVQLHSFSKEAKTFLDTNNSGKTVYAGGDDFLGFVNLNQLFEVLENLRKLFKDLVSDKLEKFRKDAKVISFSAGICIAHYKEPLSIVLKRAKDMEEKAKDSSDDKNAFGISVLTGSGQESEMTLSFGNDYSIVKKLKALTLALRDGKTSDTFIHNFQRLFEPLSDEKGKAIVDTKLLKTEFERSILRGAKKEHKTEIENDLYPDVWSIYENRNLKNFITVLNTCNFIQRHLSNPNSKNI